ncbi:AraC family transcriptional regulator [Aurantiacibacter gilvus]|uniref:AraC family transcriptional regulator n=1 Tax=Aurantiacibacter gilvus TaxID=3139141 RepID=A0ABU9IHB5_9SPHN
MTVSSPRISCDLFGHAVAWLRARNVDVDGLLIAEGISPESLTQSNSFVSLAAYAAFFERAAEVTGIRHLGLKIGKIEDPAGLGLLGTLFMSAPSLVEALNYFTQHLHAMQEGTLNRLSLSGDFAEIEYRILAPDVLERRQDAEFSIAANSSLIAAFSGVRLRPREVHFEHSCAGSYADYRNYFGCDVFFDQPTNKLIYDREGFNPRNPASHPMLAELIAQHLEQSSREDDATRHLSGKVQELLGAGISKEADIAQELGMSVSTLFRRLKAEGHSFRQLALAERMFRARRMLLATDRPIVDIALALGYSESSSFARAFRKVTGVTPRTYRLQPPGAYRPSLMHTHVQSIRASLDF